MTVSIENFGGRECLVVNGVPLSAEGDVCRSTTARHECGETCEKWTLKSLTAAQNLIEYRERTSKKSVDE